MPPSHRCGRNLDEGFKGISRLYRTPTLSMVCFLLSFLCVSTCPAFAQSHQVSDEVNPDSGVRLTLSSSSAEFYSGEVIPLDLAFTSASPKRYQINLARYDRSGRMNYEQFNVEPAEATRDPLRLYFSSIMAFLGGGLTNFAFLAPSPTVIHLNLNEWISFNRRGSFRVQVVCPRVSDRTATGYPMGGPVEVKSNWIELKITSPDHAWQQAQLARIRQTLDQMLAYVLRVDPKLAEPLIQRAIAARGPESNAGRHAIFTEIGPSCRSSPRTVGNQQPVRFLTPRLPTMRLAT
jgi:hypothetical protein